MVSIQYLRAFAAILVVFHHARYQVTEFQVFYDQGVWLFGQAGVDIFFVISGFIMWVTTSGRPMSPGRFIQNRIIRIVPMYWIVTLAVAIAVLLMPSLFRAAEATPEHVVKSLLFIPHFDPGAPGRIWPLLIPGWTLNYEMFFYGVFAAAMFLPRRLIIPAVAALLASISLAGHILTFEDPVLSFFSESIIMEFAAGMLLGQIYLQGRLAPPVWLSGLSIAAGLVMMVVLTPWETAETRLLVWGVPALLTVAGFLALEVKGMIGRNAILTLLGDASYSIYLTHILTLGVVRTGWRKLDLVQQDLATACVYMVSAIVISVAVGIVCHFLCEAPIHRLAKRLTAGSGRSTDVGPVGAMMGGSRQR
ncbi:acyltransferase [Skermanella stibiiresistens SB22]|uniref:Acyltransferase n=1 Tax=Skermanella stibiiresistens SB22 TaxID=1385369 RepID=W9H3W2_9PROT|nr:acyltransferase [Skermanella stibiiresistens SB22]